jgi:PAS domain S-box-containing protein
VKRTPSPSAKAKIPRRILRVFLAGLAAVVPVFLLFVFLLYQQVERMVTRHYADMVQDISLELRQELSVFERTVHDYGYWNDAYQFVQKPNQAFVDANFVDESLRNLRVDYVLFMDTSKKIILLKAFRIAQSSQPAFLAAIQEKLATHAEWDAHSASSVRAGFEKVGNEIYMIGISPVTDTIGKSPATGTVIFGRSIRHLLETHFLQSSHRTVTLHAIHEPSLQADVRRNLQVMKQSGRTYATQSTGDRMICYLSVNDLHDKPSFVLRIEEPSILPVLFKWLFWAMLVSLLVVGTTTCALTILMIGRTTSEVEQQRLRDMQILLDGIPAMAFLKDLESRYVMVNRRLCEAIGRPSSEIVGKDDFDLFPRPLAEKYRADDQKVLASGEPLLIDEEITDRGNLVSISTRKVPIKDENQVIVGIIGAGFDISERRQAELSLQKSNIRLTEEIAERRKTEDQLRQVQKMEAIGRLAGGVAHDFNNLLLVISGYAEFLLKEFPVGHPRRKTVEEIQRATARATTLTQQLLAFSRKQVVLPRVLNLNQIVVEIESMLHRLIGEDITLNLHCAAAAGLINADPGQIQQVVMNLAINARDAMMPNGGTLTLRTEDLTVDGTNAEQYAGIPSGPYVTLVVQDEGCGMTPEVRSHLFEPFFTTKEPGKGTGLGLSTVYGIVQQANGFIQVQSEVKKGTTFTILLPRAKETPPPDLPPPTDEQRLGGSESIFVVEDEESVRDYVSDILSANGYQVFLASNGNDAMKQYRERHFHFDLLLSDIVMPGLKGEEIASFFQTLCPDIKIVLMSGYTDERITGSATKQHGYEFLAKPFKPEELLRMIRKSLDRPSE